MLVLSCVTSACSRPHPLEDLPFAGQEEADFSVDPTMGLILDKRRVGVIVSANVGAKRLQEVANQLNATVTGVSSAARIAVFDFGEGSTHDTVNAAVERMRQLPELEVVARDELLEPAVVAPGHNKAQKSFIPLWMYPPAWIGAANWGLAAVSAPTAWSLRHKLLQREQETQISTAPDLALIDRGFPAHRDVEFVPFGAMSATGDHGTSVAGTIHARWNNGQDIESVHSADGGTLHAAEQSGGSLAFAFLYEAIARHTNARVVNHSMGPAYAKRCLPQAGGPTLRCDPRSVGRVFDGTGCDPAVTQANIESEGRIIAAMVKAMNMIRRVLIVQAAGNDSGERVPAGVYACDTPDAPRGLGDFPLDYNAVGWAAIHDPAAGANIIIAEASTQEPSPDWVELGPELARVGFSNINGKGVFAPGVSIGATTGNAGFGITRGTSFAAPFVTSAAAHLLTIEPTLTNEELRILLTDAAYTRPVIASASTTTRHLDVLLASIGIDELRKGRDTAVLSWLCDIDDGSEDGFSRVLLGDDGRPSGFYPYDIHGDGKIDMSDFRRLRDLYWMTKTNSLLDADGPEYLNQPKLDLNEDGIVDKPRADGNAYGAFGVLDSNAWVDDETSQWLRGERVRDVDVMMKAYEGDSEGWTKDDLPFLIGSADIHIRAQPGLSALGLSVAFADVLGAPGPSGAPQNLQPLSTIALGLGEHVVTTPLTLGAVVRVWPLCSATRLGTPVDVNLGDLTPGFDYVAVPMFDRAACCAAGRDACGSVDPTPQDPPPVISPTVVQWERHTTSASGNHESNFFEFDQAASTGRSISTSEVSGITATETKVCTPRSDGQYDIEVTRVSDGGGSPQQFMAIGPCPAINACSGPPLSCTCGSLIAHDGATHAWSCPDGSSGDVRWTNCPYSQPEGCACDSKDKVVCSP
ncbi:MAG: S8 family serine peptidase [Deltaproteobacteria bacterium]|nr:S8 family serine peptidase [Deltaproteobacteria bacterium]